MRCPTVRLSWDRDHVMETWHHVTHLTASPCQLQFIKVHCDGSPIDNILSSYVTKRRQNTYGIVSLRLLPAADAAIDRPSTKFPWMRKTAELILDHQMIRFVFRLADIPVCTAARCPRNSRLQRLNSVSSVTCTMRAVYTMRHSSAACDLHLHWPRIDQSPSTNAARDLIQSADLVTGNFSRTWKKKADDAVMSRVLITLAVTIIVLFCTGQRRATDSC